MLMIGFELLGLKPQPQSLSTNSAGRLTSKGDCIVMFPTNGVGFGHFTRMLAIAKRMKKLNPDLEIIFFTTMPTLHLLKPYGIPAHHIAGPKYFDGMNSEEWNALLEEELTLCFETHRPSKFILMVHFLTGVCYEPSRIIQRIMKYWMRRGSFKKEFIDTC